MLVIGEKAARQLVPPQRALDAVEQAFRHLARQQARNFPVIRERLDPAPDVYGIKSGVDGAVGVLGLKIGGYWPGNVARNLTNHQSTTVLTDPASGRPIALVGSNYLTGVRTAAACALAIRALARRDARTLGLVGTGAQSLFHIEAASLVRSFDRVLVAGRDAGRAARCAEAARAFIPQADPSDIETVAREADVLITLTPSTRPLIRKDWIQPGTHICAMGADTTGKQELETDLVLAASVYVDDWAQATSIGECQGAARAGLTRNRILGTLGELLEGTVPGRQRDDAITLFDSTGMALQDLAVAAAALAGVGEGSVPGIHSIDLLA